MATTAERTDPELWETVKAEITKSDKGGEKGEWSARKAQLAVQEYKRRGGGYRGAKRDDNSLKQWTDEKWGTRSGAKSTETGERYLPKTAREALSKEEYQRTTAKKRRDKARGKQVSGQPRDVAQKTAKHRHDAPAAKAPTKAELERQARREGIEGRSQMSKDALKEAVSGRNRAPARPAAAEEPRKQDLDDAARRLGVEGRSRMSKADLRKAIAGALGRIDTDALRKSDLRDMALSFGVERTSRMSKGELHAAVRSALS